MNEIYDDVVMFSFATNRWEMPATSSVKPVGCLFCMDGCQVDEILKLKSIRIRRPHRYQKMSGNSIRCTIADFQLYPELWTRHQNLLIAYFYSNYFKLKNPQIVNLSHTIDIVV